MTRRTSMIAAAAAGILGFWAGTPAVMSKRVRHVKYSFLDTRTNPSATKRYASKKLRKWRSRTDMPRKMQRSAVGIREKACGKHWAKNT